MYLSRNRDAIEYLNQALRMYVLALASAYAGMGDY